MAGNFGGNILLVLNTCSRQPLGSLALMFCLDSEAKPPKKLAVSPIQANHTSLLQTDKVKELHPKIHNGKKEKQVS